VHDARAHGALVADPPASDHADPALVEAILHALRPGGLLGHLGLGRLAPGMTVRQVYDALPLDRRPPAGSRPGVAGEQQALDHLRAVLDGLARDGRLQKQRARLRFHLNTKGSRMVEVVVYRRT
jgi:hypothetical protein